MAGRRPSSGVGEDIKKISFGNWEKLSIDGAAPCTRYSQAVCVCGGTVYMYGGASSDEEGGTIYHSDLFLLNLELTPLSWQLVEQKGDRPSAREGANLCVVGDKIYLYGGIDKDGAKTCAEGLYLLTPGDVKWEKLITRGTPPQTMSSTVVSVQNKKIVSFGGIVNGVAQQTLHFLDVANLEWSEVKASGTPPPPRCDHAAVVMGNKMYITAGSGSEDLWYNDLYTLDVENTTWVQQNTKTDNTPTPRDYTGTTSVANRFLFEFGGFSGTGGKEQCFSDLHYLDTSLSSLEWCKGIKVADNSSPSPRYGHSVAYYKNKFYVFAGQSTEEEFNDVWSLPVSVPMIDFEPTPLPRVRYTTNSPIPTPRKIVPPAPPKTPQPRDLEEIRSSYIKKVNELFDTLVERFQQLDMGVATLESERVAFEAEKKAHNELYERQQQELKDMLTKHEDQNEAWLKQIKEEVDKERITLAEEKAMAEQVSAELAREQEIFTQKSKKLDAIMKQVQGLKD